MKRELQRLMLSMGGSHPIAPDPERVYLPPHADIRAMLSPPPCYSESSSSSSMPRPRDSAHTRLELPPPYWADHAGGSGDRDRLLVPLMRNGDVVDGSMGIGVGVSGSGSVFSPQSELPQYSSRDDLPTYAAATGAEVIPAPPTGSSSSSAAAADNDRNEDIVAGRRLNLNARRPTNPADIDRYPGGPNPSSNHADTRCQSCENATEGDVMTRNRIVRDNEDIMTHLHHQQEESARRILLHAVTKEDAVVAESNAGSTTTERDPSAPVPV